MSLLTYDGIVQRLSAAHARHLAPSMLLTSLMADRAGVALLSEYAECAVANVAVRCGLRIEVSAEGWRVNGGAAWPTLEEAITGKAAPPPLCVEPAKAAAAPTSEDDDDPQPF